MKRSKLPKGWTEDKVNRVLAHYENQTEMEALAEDEAAYEDRTQTTMISLLNSFLLSRNLSQSIRHYSIQRQRQITVDKGEITNGHIRYFRTHRNG